MLLVALRRPRTTPVASSFQCCQKSCRSPSTTDSKIRVMPYTPEPMTLEATLLLLLVGLVAVAFYCMQRTAVEILRILKLIHAKMLNVGLFLRPDEKPDENTDDADETKVEPQPEPLPKVN